MYYEEMVKEAMEEIVDSFEKEAANRFFATHTGQRGSYGNGDTIAHVPTYNQEMPYSKTVWSSSGYPANHIMNRALRQKGHAGAITVAPGIQAAVRASADYNHNPNKSTGKAAKEAWNAALQSVANPPGKTLDNIKEGALQKYKAKKIAEAEAAKISAAKKIPSAETKLRMADRLRRLKMLGLK